MARTNFAALADEQILIWRRETEMAARDMSLIMKYTSSGTESCVQVINDLKGSTPGEAVKLHLLADLVSDGVIGDDERVGNEEEMLLYYDKIHWDLISNQVINKGKVSDQKSIIRVRERARDVLAYWLANRIDQLAILTLSGISYAFKTDGSARTGSNFPNLAFASDVRAPSANRHIRATVVSSVGGIAAGATASVAATDVLTYRAIVDAKVFANIHYVKPLIIQGKEFYIMFVRPEGIAQLKKDADYQRAVVTALPRSMDNSFFTGNIVTTDGIVFVEHRLVYNTKGLASGSKWGSGGTVDGSRALLCGSQALGMLDLGPPDWSEYLPPYDQAQGISVDKRFGLLKPRYHSIYDNAVEDFGVVAFDHAI